MGKKNKLGLKKIILQKLGKYNVALFLCNAVYAHRAFDQRYSKIADQIAELND